MKDDHVFQCTPLLLAALAAAWTLPARSATAQETPPADAAASSCLLVQTGGDATGAETGAGMPGPAPVAAVEVHGLRNVSMFAIAPGEARIFHEHDLIEIIVRETSTAKSTAGLDTQKDIDFNGKVTQWPDFQLDHLLNGFVWAGDTSQLPQVDLQFQKDFQGEGEYERSDDFTARLSAEVIEVLPNGNLILESRTRIKNDGEETVLKVTGICQPENVTPVNTILSTQLHDLRIEKVNEGALRKSSEKGLFTKLLDLLFAF